MAQVEENYQQPDQNLSKEERKKQKAEAFTLRGDSAVQDGIVTERKCTDFFFLVVFLGFLCAMMGIVIYS